MSYYCGEGGHSKTGHLTQDRQMDQTAVNSRCTILLIRHNNYKYIRFTNQIDPGPAILLNSYFQPFTVQYVESYIHIRLMIFVTSSGQYMVKIVTFCKTSYSGVFSAGVKNFPCHD